MRSTGLEEAQAGIKIAGRNINNLRYADDTTLMAESGEELKSLFMKVKEESEKITFFGNEIRQTDCNNIEIIQMKVSNEVKNDYTENIT